MNKFIYAYDSLIKRRVVHVVRNDYAISLVTGLRVSLSKFDEKEGGKMDDNIRLQINITTKTLNEIDIIMKRTGYRSTSEVIMEALRLYSSLTCLLE